MKRTGYKHVTDKEFKRTKQLLDLGLSVAQVSKINNRSTATIYYMNECETYEEYKIHSKGKRKGKKIAQENLEEKYASQDDLSQLYAELLDAQSVIDRAIIVVEKLYNGAKK